MQVTIGSATFNVSFTDDYDDDEYGDGVPGFGGTFSVNHKQYAKLHAEWEFATYSVDEDASKFDPEEHDEDDQLAVPNGDDFIVFFNAAMLDGGTWDITYEGNPYWFFHDVTHAQNDVQGGSVYVDAEGHSEDNALLAGAKLAHKHGVGLGVIFKELAKILGPFEERFNRPTEALDEFADSLDKVAR